MDDFDLLQSYATDRADSAFSSLTARYLGLVYAAALRQTGQHQSAEDVTQAVFITLARKAGSISRQTILAGWLLRTTRFAAANARRLEQRRQHYEQLAMQSHTPPPGPDASWSRIAPLLDEALDALSDRDRDAVVLRFFESQPLRQVALRLGLSEDGAQKRVSRALEKLRTILACQGSNLATSTLASLLAAQAVQPVSAALAASVRTAVLATNAAGGALAGTLASETLAALARERVQSLAVTAAGGVVFAGALIALAIRWGPVFASPGASLAGAKPVEAEPAAARATGTEAGTAEQGGVSRDGLGRLLFRVVDSTSGRPISSTELTHVTQAGWGARATNLITTDPDGRATVTYRRSAAAGWSQSIEIFRDGYVPKVVSWSEAQLDQPDQIPAEYTARLDPAVTIGGATVDEAGVPVSGVRVVFSVSGPTQSLSRERVTMMGDYHSEASGADGRWSCSHVPERFGMITYQLVHPRFQELVYASDGLEAAGSVGVERISQEDLRAGRAVMRMRAGLVVAGIVTDEAGQPVAEVKVTQDFLFHRGERSVRTDVRGAFRFENVRPRLLALTFQAEGLAAQPRLPPARSRWGRMVHSASEPRPGRGVM